jgi:hypothetical protein
MRSLLGSAILLATLSSCAASDPGNLTANQSPGLAPASGAGMFAPPTFRPADGWFTATGSVAFASEEIPRSWASNVPFVEQDELIGTSPDQLIPGSSVTDPSETLQQLRADQIVIVAALELPSVTPAPAGNPNFPDATLPLDLSRFEEQERWEGQFPQTTLRYRGLFRVNDQYVRIDVYFGEDARRWGKDATQVELDRMHVANG